MYYDDKDLVRVEDVYRMADKMWSHAGGPSDAAWGAVHHDEHVEDSESDSR